MCLLCLVQMQNRQVSELSHEAENVWHENICDLESDGGALSSSCSRVIMFALFANNFHPQPVLSPQHLSVLLEVEAFINNKKKTFAT